MTQNQEATDKWHVTASNRAKIAELVKGMCGLHGDSRTSHIESGKVGLSKDEKDVEKLSKHIQSVGNPFTTPWKHLTNLSTGVVASDEITESLLNAQSKGQKFVEEFVRTRFSDESNSLFQPIIKKKLKTFSSLKKTAKMPF